MKTLDLPETRTLEAGQQSACFLPVYKNETTKLQKINSEAFPYNLTKSQFSRSMTLNKEFAWNDDMVKPSSSFFVVVLFGGGGGGGGW